MIFILYNYIKLLCNIGYIYYYEVDIHNDTKWIDRLYNNIQECGSMSIKCVQWILPRYQLYNKKSKLSKQFDNFYSDCKVHSLSHTEKVYKKYYNKSIYDNYEIIETIGSGSIGQVYKVRDIYSDKIYALKVSHPNIKSEYYIFNLFVQIFLKIVDYKKYIPIDDVNKFIKTMKNQINFELEHNYNRRFINIYKNNDSIIIPEIRESTPELLIMDYIDSVNIDELSNLSEIYKLLTLLLIFNNNNCLNNISHGDLHKGNWGIITAKNNIKLVIYDYGFCFDIDSNEFIMFEEFMTNDYKNESIPKFIKYYISQSYNDKDKINYNYKKDLDLLLIKYANLYQPDTKIVIHDTINLFIKNNINISYSCLNSIVIFLQISTYFLKISKLSIDTSHSSYYINILSYCETYNICPLLMDFVKNKKIYSTFDESRYDKFESLKKFM